MFFSFWLCALNSDAQRTFVILQFVCPTTNRLLNFVKELGKYLKVFNNRYVFYEEWFNIVLSIYFGSTGSSR